MRRWRIRPFHTRRAVIRRLRKAQDEYANEWFWRRLNNE